MVDFDIRSQQIGDVAVVYPTGYIDFEAKEKMVPVFQALFERNIKKILINFKNVKKINSMGISVILEIIDYASEREARIRYSDLSRMNAKLFKMIGLAEYGTIFTSEAEALRDFV
ncbi:STAS domain-containing protein [bacterium]|nr:STAS domain-containing protein [bacterium]